jgi:hypothetical protein
MPDPCRLAVSANAGDDIIAATRLAISVFFISDFAPGYVLLFRVVLSKDKTTVFIDSV